jgi:hypothetical protein
LEQLKNHRFIAFGASWKDLTSADGNGVRKAMLEMCDAVDPAGRNRMAGSMVHL